MIVQVFDVKFCLFVCPAVIKIAWKGSVSKKTETSLWLLQKIEETMF